MSLIVNNEKNQQTQHQDNTCCPSSGFLGSITLPFEILIKSNSILTKSTELANIADEFSLNYAKRGSIENEKGENNLYLFSYPALTRPDPFDTVIGKVFKGETFSAASKSEELTRAIFIEERNKASSNPQLMSAISTEEQKMPSSNAETVDESSEEELIIEQPEQTQNCQPSYEKELDYANLRYNYFEANKNKYKQKSNKSEKGLTLLSEKGLTLLSEKGLTLLSEKGRTLLKYVIGTSKNRIQSGSLRPYESLAIRNAHEYYICTQELNGLKQNWLETIDSFNNMYAQSAPNCLTLNLFEFSAKRCGFVYHQNTSTTGLNIQALGWSSPLPSSDPSESESGGLPSDNHPDDAGFYSDAPYVYGAYGTFQPPQTNRENSEPFSINPSGALTDESDFYTINSSSASPSLFNGLLKTDSSSVSSGEFIS